MNAESGGGDVTPVASGRLQHRALGAIEWYQRAREGRPSPCRYFPSCSAYAHEAVTVHGFGHGTWLAVRRLLRCRPFGPSGYDPVPLSRSADGDAHTLRSPEKGR